MAPQVAAAADGERRDPSKRTVADRTFAAIALFGPIAAIGWLHSMLGASIVGTVMLVMLVTKLFVARRFRAASVEYLLPVDDLRVSLVMPMHNEDPDFAVAAVRSLLQQTRRLDHIHIVDDGSTDGGAAAEAVTRVLANEAPDTPWRITSLDRNVGKRGALAEGFRTDPDADVFVCVDSDTVLDRYAVEEGIRPFGDGRISGVAGLVSAHNWSRNVLTRLIDLRYVSAFLAERAAYSFFGAVLCCCGSLSFYRAEVVRENLDDFVDQRFLGRVATFGDDRRLTNYALRAGKVVLCERARASTGVPERIGHYLRQQARWNKSFIRESVWVLGTFPLDAGAFWLTLCEVFAWAVVSTILAATLVLWPFAASSRELLPFAALIALAAYARNAVYLEDGRSTLRTRDRLLIYALAPVYGILHLFVLTPLRAWSLCTLRRTGWGTRRSVEVRYAGPATAAV